MVKVGDLVGWVESLDGLVERDPDLVKSPFEARLE